MVQLMQEDLRTASGTGMNDGVSVFEATGLFLEGFMAIHF